MALHSSCITVMCLKTTHALVCHFFIYIFDISQCSVLSKEYKALSVSEQMMSMCNANPEWRDIC